MAPVRQPGVYVFVSTREPEVVPRATRIAEFREAEGTTLVLPRAAADHYGLTYDYEAAWITLQVHSSLAAVGLTAAVATALAEAGISCNVMAGYYHDHLFVDLAMAEKALATLAALRTSAVDAKDKPDV
jgi:hypothetical protein